MLQLHQPTFETIAPDKIADLRTRIETVADDLEAAGFSGSVVARAILAAAANRLMQIYNPLATIWIISRLQGLLCGQWTRASSNDFIENYHK